MSCFLVLLLYVLAHVCHQAGEKLVQLNKEIPSYSLHGDDFKLRQRITINAASCLRCEIELVVGIRYEWGTVSPEDLFPLLVNGEEVDELTHAGLRDFDGEMDFQYLKVFLPSTATLTLKPDFDDSRFAITVFLTEFVSQNNVIVIGVHDFSHTNKFDLVRMGNNNPSMNRSLGVYLTVVAPIGESVYSERLAWEDTSNRFHCLFEAYAGSIPPSNDKSKKIFSLPKLTDNAQKMLWRMPIVTFWLANGTCEGYSKQKQVEMTMDQEPIIRSPAVFFDISPLYPATSKEIVTRSQSFDTKDYIQTFLTVIIRRLKGGRLDLQLVNREQDGSIVTTNQSFAVNGTKQLCHVPIENFTSVWTPDDESLDSRYLVFYRIGPEGDWDDECLPLITTTTEVSNTDETNWSFVRILLPIIAFVSLLLTILCSYQYYRMTNAAKRPKPLDVDSSKWQADPALLTVDHRIGSGAFSDVYHGTYRGALPCISIYPQLEKMFPISTNGYEVAVKKPATEEASKVTLKEIQTMQSIGYHPHLLFLLGCCEDPMKPFILTEFCALGDLLTYLKLDRHSDYRNSSAMLLTDDLNRIAWEVASALEFLAEKKLVHRDVAARNVLLTSFKASKLCDFGMSKDMKSHLYTTYGGQIPVKWTSPEAIEFGLYSEKSDVWAYGILLWEMYSYGAAVYADLGPMSVLPFIKQGKRLEPPDNTPNEISGLMTSCWKYQLAQRPSFSQIVNELRTFLDEGQQ